MSRLISDLAKVDFRVGGFRVWGEQGCRENQETQCQATDSLAKLSEKKCQPETQLKFIIEAWLQIVECRRVIKCTYAYGYYLPEAEHVKRQFLRFLLRFVKVEILMLKN